MPQRRAEHAARSRDSGVAVTVMVGGCGGVLTQREIVPDAVTARCDEGGVLETLDRSGSVLARYPAGRWIRWDRLD